jgi:hypothetical protein
MTTIVTRAGKGTALTWTEMDANFTNLNNAKYESGSNPTFGTVTATTYSQLPVFDGTADGIVNAGTPNTTEFLRADGTFAVPPGTAGSVAGADTNVQFNDGGVFGAEAAFSYNKTTNTLTVENISMTGSISTPLFVSATGLIGDYLSLNQPGSAPVRGWYTPSTTEMRGNIATTNILNMKYDASYSFVVGVGVVPTAWSNTILPAYALEIGDRAAVAQVSGSAYLYWNTKIDSAYAEVARTASGTPAAVDVGSGVVTLKAAASNPGAGSAITFTTLMRARGNSDMDVSLDCGRLKFPATQVASSDANTLDDYEEGTWTPSDQSGAGLSFTDATGSYIKIGKMVQFQCEFTYPATANGSASSIGNLPFFTRTTNPRSAWGIGYSTETTALRAVSNTNTQVFSIRDSAGAILTNATLSGDTIWISGTYEASA